MAKKCASSFAADSRFIEEATDADIMSGLAAHADPEWWKQDYIQKNNQAYLRRWGALLRREARRRGLL
jgi:hypothetical protein